MRHAVKIGILCCFIPFFSFAQQASEDPVDYTWEVYSTLLDILNELNYQSSYLWDWDDGFFPDVFDRLNQIQQNTSQLATDVNYIEGYTLSIRNKISQGWDWPSLMGASVGVTETVSNSGDAWKSLDQFLAYHHGDISGLRSGTNTVINQLMQIRQAVQSLKLAPSAAEVVTNIYINLFSEEKSNVEIDYPTFLEAMENGGYEELNSYNTFGSWPYFMTLFQFPLATAGGVPAKSFYHRPGEYEAVKAYLQPYYSLARGSLGWAHYDLYGTGEIYRHLTNSLGVVALDNPYALSPSNTVGFSAATKRDIDAISQQQSSGYVVTNWSLPDEILPEEPENASDIEQIISDATSQESVNQVNEAFNTLINQVSTEFQRFASDIENGDDLLIRANVNFTLGNSPTEILEYVNLTNEAGTLGIRARISPYFQVVFWSIRMFIAFYFVRRAFDKVAGAVQDGH